MGTAFRKSVFWNKILKIICPCISMGIYMLALIEFCWSKQWSNVAPHGVSWLSVILSNLRNGQLCTTVGCWHKYIVTCQVHPVLVKRPKMTRFPESVTPRLAGTRQYISANNPEVIKMAMIMVKFLSATKILGDPLHISYSTHIDLTNAENLFSSLFQRVWKTMNSKPKKNLCDMVCQLNFISGLGTFMEKVRG